MLVNAAVSGETKSASLGQSWERPRRAASAHLIERHLLLEEVERDTQWRLLIVQAPAGYGKTAFIAQLLDAMPHHEHLDVETLAGGRVAPGAMRGAIARCPERAVICVDLGSRTLDAFSRELAHLLDHSGNNRLILASRQQPGPGLIPPARQGLVKILTAEDLRFDLAETRQMLAPHGLDPEEEYLLHIKTGGWPFGLSMMCSALGRGRRGRIQVWRERNLPDEIDEFFASDVFAKLGNETRDVLLAAGLTELVSRQSLSAGLDTQIGEAVLDNLVGNGLFTDRVAGVKGCYSVQPLFRHWLRDQARARLDPAELPRVHLRLAHHFLAAKDTRNAIEHLIEAGEFTDAAQLFASVADDLVRNERLGDIVDFVERLPAPLFATKLPIISAATIAYSMRRQSAQAQAMIELCRREIAAHAENADGAARLQALAFFVSATQDRCNEATSAARRCLELAGTQKPFDTGMSLNVEGRWLCSIQQYDKAEDVLLRAEARHDADDSVFGGSYQKGFLSTVYIEQGRIEEAELLLMRALRRAESRETKSIVGSVISAYLAQVFYEKNDVAKAHALLIDYLPLIQQQGFLDTVALAHVIFARIKAASGCSGAAADILGQGLAMGHKYDLPRLRGCMVSELVRLAVLDGNLDYAERRIELEGTATTRHHGEELVFHPAEAEGLALCIIRLRIHQGRGDEIKAQLVHEKRVAIKTRRKRRLARIQTLLAMLHGRQGEDKAAGRAMLEGVRIAQHCKLSRTVLDEGPRAVAIMLELYESLRVTADDPEVGYLEALLRSAGALVGGESGSGEAPLATLTERESEILRFVAIGLSNAELGRRICVSENTIKYHLKNLFTKCGISRRVQAVAVARKFGLIA